MHALTQSSLMAAPASRMRSRQQGAMRAIAGPACSPRAQPLVASRSSAALRGGQVMSVGYKTSAAAGRRSGLEVKALTIKESYVDLETPTGLMRTYILQPKAPGKYPGIVFFSEIFQVTAPIMRSCQIMAAHGFVVAVPEIYHEFEAPGTAFSYVGTEGVNRGNELKITKEISAYDSDSRAVVEFLERHNDCTGKIGVMGFCIGGHLAFRAAMNTGVRAAACFYATDIHKGSLGKGMQDNSLARLRELAFQGTEMMMIWGRQDPHVPTDGRYRVLQEMNAAGVNFTWHELNGAHAFMRDEGSAGRYDGELALQCYMMSVNLFRRKLHDGDEPVPSYLSGSGGIATH